MITITTEFKSELTNAERFADSKVVAPEICLGDANKQAFIETVSEVMDEYPIYIGYDYAWCKEQTNVKLAKLGSFHFGLDCIESGESKFVWMIEANMIVIHDERFFDLAIALVEKYTVCGAFTATKTKQI